MQAMSHKKNTFKDLTQLDPYCTDCKSIKLILLDRPCEPHGLRHNFELFYHNLQISTCFSSLNAKRIKIMMIFSLWWMCPPGRFESNSINIRDCLWPFNKSKKP
jgi:hypothetical protein